MRAAELLEAGLSKEHMSKHAGVYLNNLIKMIRDQQAIELQGGETVNIDPNEASRLAGLFYPDGNPDNVEVNDLGRIIPPKTVSKNQQYIVTTSGDKIPWGNIDKTQVKGVSKTYNAGDVAEAILGAAVTAKVVNKGDDITAKQLLDILDNSSQTAQKTGNKGTNVSTSVGYKLSHDDHSDKILFNVNLAGRSYIPLLKMATGEDEITADIKGIINSSVKFANSRASIGIDKMVKVVSSNQKFDQIIISSDGLGDQAGTKADLFVTINDKPVNLLSLKAGTVKQFGQGSGQAGNDLSNFFDQTFGVSLSSEEIEKIDSMSGKENVKNRGAFIKDVVYPGIYKKLKSQLSTNAGEAEFVKQVYRGILYHATLNDPAVELLIVGNKPNAPQYKLLRFGTELEKRLEGVNLDVFLPDSRSPTSITMKVAAKSISDPEIKKEPAGNFELIQIRSTAKGEGVVRTIIEMGGLLKKLASVEYEEEQEDLP